MNVALKRLSPGRVRVRGVPHGTAETRALLNWLNQRKEVVHTIPHSNSPAIDIEYTEDQQVPGRFLRTLRDRMYALRVPRSESFDLLSVHDSFGRMRLKARGLNEGQLWGLAQWARAITGVHRANVSPAIGSVVVAFDPQLIDRERLLMALKRSDPSEWPAWHPGMRRQFRWGKAAFDTAVLAACMTSALPAPILIGAVVLGSLRPLSRAVITLAQGRLGIDLLDVVATLAALGSGQIATASSIVWMVSIGDLLIDFSSDSARMAISKLMHYQAPRAFRLSADGTTRIVAAHELEPGDRILIGAGRRIAADGYVLSGFALVDEKALTGEFELKEKRRGDHILASTVVAEGQIIIEVEQAGVNTEAGKVMRILESAEQKPMTLQQEAIDLTSKLVLPTFGIAGLSGLLARDVTRAVSVIITDFGTGVRIAVPTSALAAMTIAARRDILFKGAQYMERLSKADVIIFDKTGTLTGGAPEVIYVRSFNGVSERELLRLAASAEARHDHPVAKALKAHAEKLGLELEEPEVGNEEYSVGYGLSVLIRGKQVLVGGARWMQKHGLSLEHLSDRIRNLHAEGSSTLFVAIDGYVAGLIGYSDALRPESIDLVEKLKANGRRKLVLLSGDVPSSAEAVARKVGIDEAWGGLLPEQKSDYIKRLRQQGHIVAMVGDGINDAPALALADVGISIAGGTDVAIETADVILLKGGLSKLNDAFELSDLAMRNVRRGLGIIMVPNSLAVLGGALGFISPIVASMINNGSTIAAVLAGASPLMSEVPPPVHATAVHEVTRKTIRRTAILAGAIGAAASPFPLVDESALFVMYLKLMRDIASIHGLPLSAVPWWPVMRTTLNSLLARAAVMLPATWVPGLAALVSSSTAAFATDLMGRYIEGVVRDPANAKTVTVSDLLGVMRAFISRAHSPSASPVLTLTAHASA